MNKVGIICDLGYERHHLFKSYYHSICNIFGGATLVRSIDDLYGLEMVFIGDDHYGPHKDIWQSRLFIPYCNINRIKVIVFTNEKILNSYFPWNAKDLVLLNKFKHLYHYTIDVDDCVSLNLKLNRTAISRSLKGLITNQEQKIDKAVFIGKVKCSMDSYSERKTLIPEIAKVIDLDVIESTIPSWDVYFNTIAKYKYVLSPIGNGNFFPMRFYEALAVGAIPIHQVRENTLAYYDREATFKDCIFFQDIKELKTKLDAFNQKAGQNVIWMEDNIELLLKSDDLI
jgi:hypothetical protein